MIKHIVMWKLKEQANGGNKQENAEKMKSMIEGLVGKIPEIKALEVGFDFNQSAAAFDVVLYSEFEDEESLQRYIVHPEHVKVAEFVNLIREERAVVDYKTS